MKTRTAPALPLLVLLFIAASVPRIRAEGSTEPYVAIDHPLYPEDVTLRQFFPASPEPLSVYAGRGKLVKGRAEVRLPDYFSKAHGGGDDIAYTLTPIGTAAVLAVSRTADKNVFTVIGDKDVDFSWVVHAVRRDPHTAKTFPASEQPKAEPGRYLHPETYSRRDILDQSREWKEKALAILRDFTRELGIEEQVFDIGIGGSFAYGTARGPDNPHPSDIDFVIRTDLGEVGDIEKHPQFANLKFKCRDRLKRELNLDMSPAIILTPRSYYTPEDPRFVYYSLSKDKMYGRKDRERLYIRREWYQGKWYWFRRDQWNLFLRWREGRRNRKHEFAVKENGRLAIVDGDTRETIIESE